MVVFLVSLSGCLYVFADELKEYFYRDRMYVQAGDGVVIQPFSLLYKNAQKALGKDQPITRCEIYPSSDRSWIFRASETNPRGIGYWNYYKYYYRVYINPYNGQVIHVEDTRNEFFQLSLSVHMNLLLGAFIGGPIVGYSTLIFFLLLISGLVLWWPKKWKFKSLKKSFIMKRHSSPKRFNYDLHNILGFYTLLPAALICVTGLVYSFEWADQSIQYIFNKGSAVSKRVTPKSSPNTAYLPGVLNKTIAGLLVKHKDADVFSLRFRKDETAPLDVQVRLASSRTHLFEWYYFDRNTGRLLTNYGHDDLWGGEKIRSLNYDLHVGSFGGLGTKILAFFFSMICASLPVTGFFIWYNKERKKRKSI